MTRRFMSLLASAALAFAAVPAPALADAGYSSPSLVADSNSSAIENFYTARHDAPLWLANPPAVAKLITALKRAPLDGLAEGPALAANAEAAVARAQGGDPAAARTAERLLSSAWVRYVAVLRAPGKKVIYGDPYVTPSFSAPRVLGEAGRAPSLASHVDTVSAVNSIYSKLRDAAWAEAQLPGGGNSARLVANMERAKIIPASGRFIVVDAATQRLFMYENGAVKDSMKVIVGKEEFPTPMVASMIWYTTYNPYWHVPYHLIQRVIAPNMLKQGPAYLKKQGYEIVDSWSDNPTVLSPSSVDWKAAAAGSIQVKVRQLPGPANSMGKMKFNFPNGEGIYLHDSPEKELFLKASRDLSNGCIRLEDAKRLGRWLIGAEPVAPSAAPEQHVRLPQGVPVYVTYLTAQFNGDQVTLIDDIYGRDTAGAARLASLPKDPTGTN